MRFATFLTGVRDKTTGPFSAAEREMTFVLCHLWTVVVVTRDAVLVVTSVRSVLGLNVLEARGSRVFLESVLLVPLIGPVLVAVLLLLGRVGAVPSANP